MSLLEQLRTTTNEVEGERRNLNGETAQEERNFNIVRNCLEEADDVMYSAQEIADKTGLTLLEVNNALSILADDSYFRHIEDQGVQKFGLTF